MKPSERSTYNPIAIFFENLEFENVSEIKVESGYMDIYFEYKKNKYIIEVKLSKDDKKTLDYLVEGLLQAARYGNNIPTTNIISIVYPENHSRKIKDLKNYKNLCLDTSVTILSISTHWICKKNTSIESFFTQLKSKIDDNVISKNDVDVTIEIIGSNIKKLSNILSKYYNTPKHYKDLIKLFGEDYELFLSLGNLGSIKTIEKNNYVILDIISYLFLNQIIFYHLYTSLNRYKEKCPPVLCNIVSLDDLKNNYFGKLRNIDYEPIYDIDVLCKIPNTDEILNLVNTVINIIKIFTLENISHGFFGQLFHELLPYKSRKILSAFYTNPKASEILARLTIKNWNDSVLDPACGSGTLLVSAYKTKKDLYDGTEENDIHKYFVEENITGIDIMPFSCHLASINISVQDLTVYTKKINIAQKDSLDIIPLIKNKIPIERAASSVSGKLSRLKKTQHNVEDYYSPMHTNEKKDDSNNKDTFTLDKSQIVLMNPPFSDRKKLPTEYKEKINNNKVLVERCGKRINLWGYFLALLEDILSENGRAGVIIPSSFLRGTETKKIRDNILTNYHIEYIIKPVGDLSFSEDTSFRDIMLIIQRKIPNQKDNTKIVFLKKCLREATFTDTQEISKDLKNLMPNKEYIKKDFDCYFVKYDRLTKCKDSLIQLIWASNLYNLKIVNNFINKIETKGKDKLIIINKELFKEGIQTSPKGLSKYIFITDCSEKSRLIRSNLILSKINSNGIKFSIKKENDTYFSKINDYLPSIRTINGIRTINKNINDFVLINDFVKSDRVIKDKVKIDWNKTKNKVLHKKCNMALAHKFTPYSENVGLLAVYSDDLFYPSDSFTLLIPCDDDLERSKLNSLFFNSTLFFTQMFIHKKSTEEKNIEIKKSDLSQCKIIDFSKISDNELKNLTKLFDEIKDVEFPSFKEQFKNTFWVREKIDVELLKVLGIKEDESKILLERIYKTLYEEICNLNYDNSQNDE